MEKLYFDFTQEKLEKLKSNKYYKILISECIEAAENYKDEYIKAVPYSAYVEARTVGNQKYYTSTWQQSLKALNAYGLLVACGHDEYIDKLQDCIWTICDQYAWSYPGHMKYDTPEGPVLIPEEYERTWIDLMAAEKGYAISEIIAMIGDKIDPRVVRYAKENVQKRLIESYINRPEQYMWETVKGANWTTVCGCSLFMATLYMGTDKQIKYMTDEIIKLLDNYIEGFGNDGNCPEGCNYWSYGFGHFVIAAEALRIHTDGKTDYFKNDKVKKLAMYQQKVMLNGDKCGTFGDSETVFHRQNGLSFFLAEKYEDVYVPDSMVTTDYEWDATHWGLLSRNLFWLNDIKEQPLKKETVYFEKSGVLIKHSNGYDFIARAGGNYDPHNHNDVGHFMVCVDNEMVLCDLNGNGYTAAYFSNERYSFLNASSLGHNVPIINGQAQRAGKFYGKVNYYDEKTYIAEFKDVYPDDNLKSVLRKFELDDYSIVLTDKFNFSSGGNTVIEHFITKTEPYIDNDAICIGKSKIYCDAKAEITKCTDNGPIPYYKIEFLFENIIDELEFKMKIETEK